MRIELKGIESTKENLEILGQVLTQLKTAFHSIGEYLLHVVVVEAFESEGAIYGKRWTPLNPEYALRKSTVFPGRGILEASGRGRRAYRGISTDEYLTIVNPIKYMSDHQHGNGVPQRIVMDIQARQRRKIREILQDDLMRRMRFFITK